MNKPVHALAVLKKSYNYLLKNFSLMKYFWIAAIPVTLTVFQKQLGDMSGLASVIHTLICIVVTAIAVTFIRFIVKGERMSWHRIFAQFFEIHYWRYYGTIILGVLSVIVLPAILFILALGSGLLMIVLGIMYIPVVLYIYCLLMIAVIRAASGGRKSIRTAYQLMKGSVVRFFGGLLLAYIPSAIMFGLIYTLGSVDGGSMGVAYTIVGCLVLSFLAVFVNLLVTVYSAKYYKAIQGK